MNLKILNLHQTSPIAIVSQTNQSSQPTSMSQTVDNIIYLAEIFAAFVLIGFILGCITSLRKFKKQQHQRLVEYQEIEISEMIQKLSPQTQKQIETLEKIWNKTP